MASRKSSAGRFVAAPHFAFRSPLLPFAVFAECAGDLCLPEPGAEQAVWSAALEAAQGTVRRRLAAALALAHVRDALFLASPGLESEIDVWLEQPDSARGYRIERALMRYFARLAGRATPFGLFSGIAVGRVDRALATRLRVDELAAYRRHTRLDNDYLFALSKCLGELPEMRTQLPFWPNQSLFAVGDGLRYVEARLDDKRRLHHLVKIDSDEYLDVTLARARPGATADSLARALADDDPDIEIDEAREYIDTLIDAQILVSRLEPAVTGAEPLHGMIEELQRVADRGVATAAACVTRLSAVRDQLRRLDEHGLGARPEQYRQVADDLARMPAPVAQSMSVDLARLFQVDMVKPAPQAVLGEPLMSELERAIEFLYKLPQTERDDPLAHFRSAFQKRYEGRAISLARALDEDCGIGFMRGDEIAAEPSPLLQDVAFARRAALTGERFTAWHEFLAERLQSLGASGSVLELSERDLDRVPVSGPMPNRMPAPAPLPLPDAFAVFASLAADSAEALAEGRWRLHVRSISGPSGARLTGRFCHAAPAVEEMVRAHIRAEEALAEHAVFAEVVHLPEGRIGNVICRPVLRAYEIPYLGLSGAPRERQLLIDDLLVSVAGERIVLTSRSLGREVLPRISSAHNLDQGVGVYRFLGYLQHQGVTAVGWSWGPLAGLPHLPRVVSGRLVLARACWRLGKHELARLAHAGAGATESERGPAASRARVWRALQEIRETRSLPRFVALADGDNELPVDLDNPISCDSLARLLAKRESARLCELFPGPDELPCEGPEGRYTVELVVPYTRAAGVAAGARASRRDAPIDRAESRVRRVFPPGSEWLYAKLYAGPDAVDSIISDILAPLCDQARARQSSDCWFFIRYGDPDHHLRLRWHGSGARLSAELLPALHQAIAPLMDQGIVWSMSLDTYERELERYGGARGIELAERLFEVESDAVVALLPHVTGDERADMRWQMALLGVDRLLDDLRFTLADKLALMSRLRDSFGREFAADAAFYRRVGAGFRERKAHLEQLLEPGFQGAVSARAARPDDGDPDEHPLAACLHIMKLASERARPILDEVRAREQAGELRTSLPDLTASYIHMQLNRILRSAPRAQELIVYDYLRRLYAAQNARGRSR